MSYLKRIAEAKKDDDVIYLDDIYEGDPQYQQLLKFTTDLLYKFTKKFHITEEKMLDLFIQSLKKEF